MPASPELPIDDVPPVGPDDDGGIEYLVDTFIVDGQRQQFWLRVAPDHGEWHNAAVFRRDGKLSPLEAWTAGIDWHLPPDAALERARRLDEKETLELYERALRPRPPLI